MHAIPQGIRKGKGQIPAGCCARYDNGLIVRLSRKWCSTRVYARIYLLGGLRPLKRPSSSFQALPSSERRRRREGCGYKGLCDEAADKGGDRERDQENI